MTCNRCFLAILGGLGLLLPACVIEIGADGDERLVIAPDAIASLITGSSYRIELAVADDTSDLNWEVISGSLPAGLSLSQDDGVIAGRPTLAGTYNFTVKAKESGFFARHGTKAYTLIVIEQLTVTLTLEKARVGVAYASAAATITGGVPPYTLEIVGLPGGLDFDFNTYQVVGTPVVESTGERIDLQVTDSGDPEQSETVSATLVISPVAVSITTESLADAPLGESYNVRLTASGGRQPYTWAVTAGALPGSTEDSSYLRLSASTGVISGTPGQRATTQTFTITVTDRDSPESTDARDFKIVVPVAILTTALDAATIGAAYDESLSAAGGLPLRTDAGAAYYHWSLAEGAALPAGLTLDEEDGVISGTPEPGATTATFTVRVADNDTPASQAEIELTITVGS